MALFKILKGNSNNLVSYDNAEVVNGKIPFPALDSGKTLFTTADSTPITEGYAYFTEDTHKFYIDTKDKRLNLYTDHADYATYDENGRNLAELSEVSYENIDDTGSKIGTININGIEHNVTCPTNIISKPINKYVFTAKANQNTFTIPFDFDDSSALTLYYNGIMLKETDHYTIEGKVITLNGRTSEADDYLTVMGIEGAAAIDFGQEATDAIAQMNAAKSETITAINNIKSQASTEINTVKSNAITEINNLVDTLPSDTSSIMFLNKINTMTANSKITMDSSYTPNADGDIATKKYVDNSTPATFTASKGGTVPASGGGTTKYLRADGTWTTIDKTPVIGTNTDYYIYIGSTQPASGTAPLIWIDTTAKTGTFKYRTSTTGTWTPVPVAWI